ncbi:transmembrane amino acid transporter protein-domain-containing protein [Gongronella butleri]|nr:transmembrane amino acid transporter protein-domain-containing protein [Gongronella butleri]
MATHEHIPEEELSSLVQQHLVSGHGDRDSQSTGEQGSSNKSSEQDLLQVSRAEDGGGSSSSRQQLGEQGQGVFEAAEGEGTIRIPFHLQGAAVTHDIYQAANQLVQRQLHRSKSSNDIAHGKALVHDDDGDNVAFENLSKPGGFRRFHLQQQRLHDQQDNHETNATSSASPAPSSAFHELFRPASISSQEWATTDLYRQASHAPTLASSHHMSLQYSHQAVQNLPAFSKTNNFLEYLALASLMDHFAGEDLSDTDNEDDDTIHPPSERTPLLTNILPAPLQHPHRPQERRKLRRQQSMQANIHRTNITKTVFLLFKAFIGSGILFLPKAFSNGGLFFSIGIIWFMGAISLYCFLLLLQCKNYITGSYGDIGEALYGVWMRRVVLFSIAISQLGFVCGGTIFIIENIIEAVRGWSHNAIILAPKPVLLILCLILMPFVLLRNIAKISPTALLSDVLIISGLLVLVGYDLVQVFVHNGEANGSGLPSAGPGMIWTFNPKHYSVFIGTAVYSFEGIGLIIPIRDAMEKPEKFPMVLSCVMFLIALTLCMIGTLGYIAFGDTVETVALLNLPPSTLANTVQFGYAVAVQLSNVLALFPTIRIVEQALFGDRTGKYDIRIKWEKNMVRFMIVIVVGIIALGGAKDLDKFISLIGSVCCCPLSLIFPPLFHIKLQSTKGIQRYIDMSLIAFGVGTMLFTLYNTSMQWGTAA